MDKGTQNHKSFEAGVLYRAAEIGAVVEDARTVELSFSSEISVDRFFGSEILDHSSGSVVLDWINSGRAPLLADHDPAMQIGVVEKAEIGKDRVGRAVVRFGKSAQAESYFQDVKDGIRGNISVGYRIHQMLIEESANGVETYRASKWEPLEISLVSIPADQSVGVGRSDKSGTWKIEILNSESKQMETRKMEPNANNQAASANNQPATITVDADEIRATFVKENQNRTNEIIALAKRHNLTDKGMEFVATGKSVDEFRSFVLEALGAAKPVETANDMTIGLNDKEARQYSFLRAIRAMAMPDQKHIVEAAAFELEVCDAVGQKFKGRKFSGNLQVPTEVLFAQRNMQQRDLNVASGPAGGYSVGTNLQASSFIELLRNRLLVKKLGARVLTGLEGNLSIPKQTGGATAYVVTEGGDVTESQQSIGQVALTPKTVGAYTEFTRRMLLQSSMDVENFVRDDLAKTIATKVDSLSLKGTGTGGEPTGILNTNGIGTVGIASNTFTFGKVVDLESEVAIDNADLGSLAYMACAADRGRMKQTEKAAGTAQFIWSNMPGQPGVGEVNGYPAYATNQLAEDEMVFGNWEDLIIGEWGVLDMLVNPYAKDTSGGVRVTALQDFDCAVRHAESFARTTAE